MDEIEVGAALGCPESRRFGELPLVRLNQVRPAMYRVAWSLSSAARGRSRWDLSASREERHGTAWAGACRGE